MMNDNGPEPGVARPTPLETLTRVEVYHYYDRPLIWLDVAPDAQLWLALLLDETPTHVTSLYTPLSDDERNRLEQNQLTLRDAIVYCRGGWGWLIDQYDDDTTDINPIRTDHLRRNQLPEPGLFLHG